MKLLEKTIGRLNTLLIILAGAALLAVMGLSVVNVICRMLDVPFIGAYELVGFAGAIVIAAALGQTQERKDHVPVDIITRRYPAALSRLVDVLKYVLKLAFAGLVAWKMTEYALHIRHTGEVSETRKLIFYPYILCVAAGFAVLACTVGLDLVRSLIPAPPAPEPPAAVTTEELAEEEVPLP